MLSKLPPQAGNTAEAVERNGQSLLLPALDQALLQGRLHPLTLVFAFLKIIRRMIIPAIPLLFLGNRWVGLSILGAMLSLSVIHALVRYFSFNYRVASGELIIKQGILERTERHIPLERVQEISTEQDLLHRLLGVVEAKIETAGSEGPEASLSVVSREDVERLREAIAAQAATPKTTGHTAEETVSSQGAREVVRQLSIQDLVLVGLTSNHLLSALALFGMLWALVDDLFPDTIYQQIATLAQGAANRLLEQDTQSVAIVTALGIVAILLLGILFSTLGSVVLFYGFTFSRRGEELHRAYGLLTHRASSLPRRRIQVLEIEESFLRRLFHLATLRADTVGTRSREDGEKNKGRGVLLPIIPRDEVSSILPVFFPDLDSDPAEWQRVSRLAIRRGTLKGASVCTLVAAGATFYYQNPIWLWLLALLPAVYLINLLRYHNLGYALGDRYFRTRRGWLGRSTHIVPIRKAQAIEVRQTFFDRRLGLASLIVDTAGQAYTGGGPQISNLPLAEAYQIAQTLAHRAAATQWGR